MINFISKYIKKIEVNYKISDDWNSISNDITKKYTFTHIDCHFHIKRYKKI